MAAASDSEPKVSFPTETEVSIAQDFLAFNDGSSSVFHATLEAQKRFEAAGEQGAWPAA